MFVFKLIRIRFFSPIIFQQNYIEPPWRIPSDYLVRALTYAYLKLYSANEWFSSLEQDLLRVSSLILIHKGKLFLPDYGIKGYTSLDGDVVDSTSIVTKISRVRVSRVEGIDSTPFEDYQLLASKYEWGIVLAIHRDYYGELFYKILAALRLLGDLGLGARKSRGGGRFKIVQVDDLESYGVKILTLGMGKLISRYRNYEKDLKVKAARKMYIERTRVYYGNNKFKEIFTIAEGSEVEISDNGLLEYFKNDLFHNVPLYYRPLMVAI